LDGPTTATVLTIPGTGEDDDVTGGADDGPDEGEGTGGGADTCTTVFPEEELNPESPL
jgi:hypothetical protein